MVVLQFFPYLYLPNYHQITPNNKSFYRCVAHYTEFQKRVTLLKDVTMSFDNEIK